MRVSSLLVFTLCFLAAEPIQAADFKPDPLSVQRYGPAYRYPQAGWIVLHIEGEPYERGVQHGRLLAPEIAAHVRCFAATQNSKAPTEGWKQTRTLANALFLRRYTREYLDEMKGIADGASAAGARFDNRPIDLLDVVAINAWPEIDTLDSALNALPTGLEGVKFPDAGPEKKVDSKPMRCSAFAATGPATKDGKVVFGHITMFSLYPANFYNVWLDVQPAKGHRVMMQSYPGGMQSGLDYYMNDVGLLITETTISQTKFDATGMALGSRIRDAMQYAGSIDEAVAILTKANNGLYTNEWLLADVKTNEIAMFELGTHKTKLWRSSKNEWFGGTEGFYWGCNNTKDLDVRMETVASVQGRPNSVSFHPTDRDKMWLKLFDENKGKIDESFGKLAFTTPPLAAYHSVDAKYTTTDMAKEMKTWCLFGPPLGRTWEPTFDERTRFPEVRPLISNPWAIIHGVAPDKTKPDRIALDVPESIGGMQAVEARRQRRSEPTTVPAWRGTLFPKSSADIWLTSAFANYERIVAQEKSLAKAESDHVLSKTDREKIAVALFQYRSDYELGCRAWNDVPLTKIESDLRRDEWYRIASGKGVLLLSELRREIGADKFDDLMERFGSDNAGKEVTTATFVEAAERTAGKKLDTFFRTWLNEVGLPDTVRNTSGPFAVTTFYNELEQTLIVYGTADEVPTNREAAEALQQAIRARHANFTVPIKTDKEVTEAELKTRHLLLIGRPDSNTFVERFRKDLPVTFGVRSFTVNGDTYAHAGSAVLAAAPSPINARYSIVVVAGLEAASTLRAAPRLPYAATAEVVVLPNTAMSRALIVAR
jgi:hypothetical protein